MRTKLGPEHYKELKYYVYLLVDPRNDTAFYVGKGKKGRINQHLMGAISGKDKDSDKKKTILSIEKSGHKVKEIILRHGMSENEAFEVESAIIDFIGINNLTNIVKGHHADEHGKMSLENLIIKYEAPEAKIEHKMVLININKLYREDMSFHEIYEATRKYWKASHDKISQYTIVCSVYQGIIKEIFEVDKRGKARKKGVEGKVYFIGTKASNTLRDKYLNTRVKHWAKKGAINPLRYT